MLVSWPSFCLDIKFVYAQDEMLSLMLAMEERVAENTRRIDHCQQFYSGDWAVRQVPVAIKTQPQESIEIKRKN